MGEDRFGQRRRLLEAAGFPPSGREDSDTNPVTPPVQTGRAYPEASWCLALICTRSFLPLASVAARSFLDHHPEFQAFLLLVDGEQVDIPAFREGHVVLLPELGLRHSGWYAAKYTASEFSNALKPVFLRFLAPLAANVVYIDCDIAVFSRLTELLDLLRSSDLVLVPHMLAPFPRPEHHWVHPNRADIFNSGIVNAGCFGVKPHACSEFLDFWADANLGPGAFYDAAGYQTDQQYLNWALVMVPGAALLRDSRYNVAYWSLHDRDFRVRTAGDGTRHFEVDNRPLGFFHFSGYDVRDRLRLSRHDHRHSVYNLPAVAEILSWYSDRVLDSALAPRISDSYRFDALPNGLVLSRFLRQLLKHYEIYIPKCDPFTAEGADTLCAVLMRPLPATGSLLPLVAAEIYESRPDLQGGYPNAHAISPADYWRWFCRHAGVEYGIQPLIDRFRRALVSDSVSAFAESVNAALQAPGKFLGTGRMDAARELREAGYDDLADALLEGRPESFFFSDLEAAFEIYFCRPDLQAAFPDILDRDHAAFCDWLTHHAADEHGCPASLGERFRQRAATLSLARIFSFAARRDDVGQECQRALLADNPEPVLRALVRGAGEGLEYDLEDVVVLRLVHRLRRELLVPFYLELPAVRRSAAASRIAESSLWLLPDGVRDTAWARAGCQIHASYFTRFDSSVEEEIGRRGAELTAPSRDVLSFLSRRNGAALHFVEPAYRSAVNRQAPDASTTELLWRRFEERRNCPGVNIFGYFASDIGIGESSRGLAKAASLLRPVNRIPLHTAQLKEGTELPKLFQRFDYLTDTNIFVTYPHQFEDLLSMLRPEQIAKRRNVAHLAWEQEDANPWWKPVYDRYDELWAISEFAATPFRRMFGNRVRVVPNVLDYESFPNCGPGAANKLRGEFLDFLFVFDANSSMERKNPEAVIEAFTMAFRNTRHASRVRLRLKVGGMHRPEHALRVERLMRKAEQSGLPIRFDGRQLLRDAMLRMIASADCYVSLHRAEGFGYTMAEAMFYGVPVIASGYSGNLEYMTSENSLLVPCSEAFVKEADGPFQRGSIWGQPDLEIAANMMRLVAEQPEKALALAQCGQEAVLRKLNAAAVAETIRSSLCGGRA